MRFPEFKDDWQETNLNGIATIIGGGTPDTNVKEYWNGNIQWFTPTEVGHSKYVSNSIRTISEKGLKYSSAKTLPAGTILLSSRATVGECSISTEACATNQGFQSLVVDTCVNNEFIFYLIHTKKKELLRKSSGSTFLEISNSEIKKIKCQIPSLQEQKKLAAFLSLVDERIERQRQLIEALKRYKRGYFQQIISDLDTTEFEVADVVKEYTEKTQTQNEYPILSSTLSGIQLQNSYFNKQAASENTVGYKIVPYGYFTYRSMSDTGDFRFNLQTIIDKGIVSPAYPVFSILDDHESEFVEYILNETDKIKNQLRIIKEGGTRYALSFAKFKNLTISLPTKQQQKNFVNQLRLFNKLLSREETIYIDLQKHKSALLQQMFI